MAASNDSKETYLHLFIGCMDTALDNIDNVFSPSSSKLGIPDKLEKLGEKIHTLLRQHRASTATLPNTTALPQLMDMLRNRNESFERKLELMWQLLKEIEDTEETNISYNSEENEFWCCICDSTMFSPMTVIEHSKGKRHQFMEFVEKKKSNLVEGFYSGDRPKEEELMWEILDDIDDDNISDLGNRRYYCQECEVNICGPRNVIQHIDGEKHGNASRPSSN